MTGSIADYLEFRKTKKATKTELNFQKTILTLDNYFKMFHCKNYTNILNLI